jgi:hypothetical protein
LTDGVGFIFDDDRIAGIDLAASAVIGFTVDPDFKRLYGAFGFASGTDPIRQFQELPKGNIRTGKFDHKAFLLSEYSTVIIA